MSASEVKKSTVHRLHLGEVLLQGLTFGPLLANLTVDHLLLLHQHIDLLGEFVALGQQLLGLHVEDVANRRSSRTASAASPSAH